MLGHLHGSALKGSSSAEPWDSKGAPHWGTGATCSWAAEIGGIALQQSGKQHRG